MKIRNQILLSGLAGLAIAVGLVAGCDKKSEPSVAAAAVPVGDDHQWLTDFDQAKQIARQENKDLLINFAGSDWCYWCKKLDKEVFSKPSFEKQAADQFVMVLIDFPQDKSGQSAAVRQQNERLAQQFDVQGFPTVFLADASGQPYARTGYREGGPQAYLEHLRELRAQKALP